MEIDQIGRLRDILQAAQLIQSYVEDTTETQFAGDFQKQDAVIRRLEIIGEAVAHLTEATRGELPQPPFRKMCGMRNIVAHDYASVDLNLVWEVATLHVPQLCAELQKFFASQQSNTENNSE